MTRWCISLGCALVAVFGIAGFAQSPQPQRPLTVQGRVFAAATNATVADSHVLIIERTSRGRVVRTVRTDAAGNYQAMSVLPGSYLVARARGYGSKYATISSQGGNSITVPFSLEEAASLSGRIVDTLGAPVVGATVRVAYSGDIAPFLIAADLGETQTDTNGEFTVSNVNPGQRFVVEALTSVHPVEYSFPRILAPAQKYANGDLVLKTGGQLNLLVRDAATGRPLPNAQVLIRRGAQKSSGGKLGRLCSVDSPERGDNRRRNTRLERAGARRAHCIGVTARLHRRPTSSLRERQSSDAAGSTTP